MSENAKSEKFAIDIVERAMANMEITFRTGPVLANPRKIQMPLPNEHDGEWNWL